MTFRLEIETTINQLLLQEDTDGDKKITVEDKGPKAFPVHTTEGNTYVIKGTYYLSNLLQELILAQQMCETVVDIDSAKIEEPPVYRISRMIKDYYWKGLTRTMDAMGMERLMDDTKNKKLLSNTLRIYVPHNDSLAWNYYRYLRRNYPIEVIKLPETIDPEYVKTLNDKPGLLALKLVGSKAGVKGLPFVVPGGRFNEMYGWDSYFEAIGLLTDGEVELAKAMADHFQYEIQHYGKILNANRSYYLTRTQPPFYTSLIREVFEHTQDKEWLESHLKTAIHEYETVWMVPGKRCTANGLNRYLAEGIGIPPETEEGHYDAVITPFAKTAKLSVAEYIEHYAEGRIQNEALDHYFLHDRTVRESGHDTSYRIEGTCANLNLVELNAMLYKYEIDFAALVKTQFNDCFFCDEKVYHSGWWSARAEARKELVNMYLWNPKKGLYFDYDVAKGKQMNFVAATTLMPLWAKLCSATQANQLVNKALPLLKQKGGIAGCDRKSRGAIRPDRPQKQWDYPNGWAPHQMMIWKGLHNYGFHKEARELIYRWLFMITKNAMDYNGTIPEKYDVVKASHHVFAEYGNVGTDFEYMTQEGFGWMNASYQYGLSLLDESDIDNLNTLVKPEVLFKS
ncbi:MAG: alpha,alpha-trehalase [Bacteroidota bacterium]